ncbi:recombinase family protein [Streptomyces sp. NPDC013187]|uniref:recombinase family protein n=1 Tax=Streptomyces sp. NPDC013187 TaxID=3364865 RepID=UPI00367DA339
MGKRTRVRTRSGPIRVAIYLRVSTLKQVDGFGLGTQEEVCVNWLNYKIGAGKYVIHKIYVDGGVSGKKASRPDLDILNEDMENGLIDLVVFGKLDRIGRTMEDIHLWVFNATKRLNIRVATGDGRIDSDDDMFGIMLSLLSYMAELEHTLILERTSGGRYQKLMAGGWPLGQPPYGVVLEGKGSKAVPVLCEDEVHVILMAEKLFVEEGMDREEAAQTLNALGKLTRTGKPWTGANLARRITSTALDGFVEFKIETEPGDDDEEAKYETFRIPVPSPIPDPKRVAALRAAVNRKSTGKKYKPAAKYLLSQRLLSSCGWYYTGGKAGDAPHAYYQCAGKRQRDAEKCSCAQLPVPLVDQLVWEEVVKLLDDKGRFRELADNWLGSVPSRLESYRKRLAELDEQIAKRKDSKKALVLEKLTALFADEIGEDMGDVLTEDTVAEFKASLQQKEEKLQEERDRVAKWIAEAEGQAARVGSVIEVVENLSTKITDFTEQQRADLLELLDVRVQVLTPGERMRKGIADPLTEWHRETGTLVPIEITDEQWQTVDGILPDSRQNWTPKREVFEAILGKLRTAARWSDVEVSGNSWSAVRRRAETWRKGGHWMLAMEALKGAEGVPVPPLRTLPPMEVTGVVDPRYTTRALEERGEGADGEGCNRTLTSAQSSPR